ncbi:hypothetical protein MNEG_10470 [Monoraphidium neglectum]|uniref:K Homology domain-containing protein n=1 Tax=Monoraphidium neglectum TaxID=145388 RepID=A0A0D2M8W2_9CHLO|nr:hypothetical protein MNEG_10470 [Monoraphidium neglectum]KIY97491.1 hypothetical protein MNEG_10470 [Monoraphidium neglectum]|eukprot:XP_013896511.1 hypothetical protein MNEG_10470 [Monoraphidium neglectum]
MNEFTDDRSRLEQLKAAAEAQMRRPAPAIGGVPAAKRQRTDDAAAEQEAAVRVARYNYSAPDTLLGGGAVGLVITCSMQRQMSATKEGVELIKRKLAAGAVCSLVKVGCRGVVLVLVQHAQQKQQAKEQQKQQPQEQQEQQEQQPQQQQEQQQEQHGQQQEQQEQQQEQQEQQQEQQEQQQQQQLQTEGEEGEQKQPEKKDRQQLQSGEATDDAQQHKHERDAAAGGLINMVDVAASILADVESGATPHARFVQRIIPAQRTCALEAGALRSAAEAVCREYLAQGNEPEGAAIDFAVAFKNRAFEGGAGPESGGGSSAAAAQPKPAATPPSTAQQQGGASITAEGPEQPPQPGHIQQQQEAGQSEQPHSTTPDQQQKQQQQQPSGVPLQRNEAIAILANAMIAASGGRVRVNLKSPTVTVITEVVPVSFSGRRQLIAALAVAPTARLVSVKPKGLQDHDNKAHPSLLHYRLLVPVKKAGAVIGKGGEFITKIKDLSRSKLSVDKPLGDFEERVIHVESPDTPDRPRAPAQEALLMVLDRVVGDEQPDGSVKPPDSASARLLVRKYEIGSVLGLRGVVINEIRTQTGASVKIEDNAGDAGMPIALPDDQLVKHGYGGPPPPRDPYGAPPLGGDYGRGPPPPNGIPMGGPRPMAAPSMAVPPMGAPPPYDGPPTAPGGPPGGAPGGGGGGGVGMLAVLPPAARVVFADNPSVDTRGLEGMATVEYRVLVPTRKGGVIIGERGSVIRHIRDRFGAKLNLPEALSGAQERVLQIMSTEDVRDPRCDALEAAMYCADLLLHDRGHERWAPPARRSRARLGMAGWARSGAAAAAGPQG